MTTPAAQIEKTISFGPFSLAASERLLTKDGAPVELSGRPYDILLALLSRPNEVISKSDLMAQVWPGINVEEGSLRFHVATLRKTLGDRKNGARYISTSTGRGYCFVAPVSRSSDRNQSISDVASGFSATLPVQLTRMVGRDDDILKLSTQLNTTRFVTIVGAGGVGKTTVAVAVGHQLLDTFGGAVLFADLSMLNDPKQVPKAIGSMLGLSVQSNDAMSRLLRHLRDKRILLILDTCEHLVEAVAELTSEIFAAAPDVHLLTTSREVLQVDDEYVYRLGTLAFPTDDHALTATNILAFPATRLFVERAIARGAQFDFSDAETAIVASICRKLDGVPLAIELAARHVESYGLVQTAALLDQRPALLCLYSRGGPPRQKTLQATLDWSYGLLSELERTVLHKLAAFPGYFTLDAALAMATSTTLDHLVFLSALDSLVAKSMVATCSMGSLMRYRLLDTTRVYALEINTAENKQGDQASRHTSYDGWSRPGGTVKPLQWCETRAHSQI